MKSNVWSEILSLDIGISTQENLSEPFDDRASPTFVKLLFMIPKIIKYKIQGNNFDRVDLDLKYLDWQSLMQKRELAVSKGLVFDFEYVDAKVRFREKMYSAKVRLKGYGADHHRDYKRYSLLLKLSNGETILGFSKFAIQQPYSRFFPFDFLYNLHLLESQNLASNKKYAHIYVNGENWGIMNLEESLTKEFLEKQQSKESIIVRFPSVFEAETWNTDSTEDHIAKIYQASLGEEGNIKIQLDRALSANLNIHLYNQKKYLENTNFRKYYSYVQQKSVDSITDLFDINKMAQVFLFANVWGSRHSLLNYNLRYYFNPYTLKLEPISTDQLWPVNLKEDSLFKLDRYRLPYIFSSLLKLPDFNQALVDNFDKVDDIFKKNERYKDQAKLLFPLDSREELDFLAQNITLLEKNINSLNEGKNPFLESNHMVLSNLDSWTKNDNQVPLQAGVAISQEESQKFANHVYLRHFSNGTLDIYNLLTESVTLLKVYLNGVDLKVDKMKLDSRSVTPLIIRNHTKLLGLRDNQISVLTEHRSNQRVTSIKSTLISENINNPLNRLPWKCESFCDLVDGDYLFKKGNWTIREPMLLEGDAYISSGTNLSFAEGAYLILKGALIIDGTLDLPVNLISTEDTWKGIYVINADNRSFIKHAKIQGLQALSDGLLNLTGALNFYNSDVTILSSSIKNVFAEDALNIVKSNFFIEGLTISNAASDGIDSDFSVGDIQDSYFQNIAGDALDFSGSKVSIRNVKTFDIGDKSISGGEESFLDVQDSELGSSAIGITSKDGSSVRVKNTIIRDYKLFGVMTYDKKNFYTNASSMVINNSTINGITPFLRETGSVMEIDDIAVPESKLNVDALYSTSKK